KLAVGPTLISGALSQSIYYSTNVAAAAANTNAVTVTFAPAAAFPDVRILEYSGIDPANPLDATAGSSGNGVDSSTASVALANNAELLVAATTTQTSISGPGSNFTARLITSPDGDIAEDSVVPAPGYY